MTDEDIEAIAKDVYDWVFGAGWNSASETVNAKRHTVALAECASERVAHLLAKRQQLVGSAAHQEG